MDPYLQLTLGAVFLAGLSGGAHCAAMCGPLIGIACGRSSGGRSWIGRALAYNGGRIASYATAGAVTGALGGAGLAMRGTPLIQQTMLLAMSLSMLLFAAYVAGLAPFVRAVERAGAAAWRHLAPATRRFLPVDSAGRAFGAGLVFGWLPCGMVYVALMAALASAHPVHGALVMVVFGLGTVPNVLAISAWFRGATALAGKRAARWLISGAIAGVGAWGALHALYPAAASEGMAWCLQIPGIGPMLGGLL